MTSTEELAQNPGGGARRPQFLLPEQPADPSAIDRLLRAGLVAWAIVGVALAAWILLRLLDATSVLLPPVLVATTLSYLLNPPVSALERRGVPRLAGTALLYLTLLLMVGLALSRLVPMLGDEISRAVEGFPAWIRVTEGRLDRIAARWGHDVDLNSLGERAQRYLSDPANRASVLHYVTGLGAVTTSLLQLVIVGISGPIVAFYLLVDLPRLRRGTLAMIPPRHRAELQDLGGRLGRAVGGFFRGQLLVAIFVGVASSVGLALVDLPFWLLVGVVAGVANLVPLVGPWIAGTVAVVIALVDGDPLKALQAALVLLAVQQIDNHLISPNVMSRTVQLHPVVVILAILLGATAYGLIGMLVAVPVVAAAKVCFVHLWARHVSYGGDLLAPAARPVPAAGQPRSATGTPRRRA
jgi:predicted PurR-regulated permease PerM